MLEKRIDKIIGLNKSKDLTVQTYNEIQQQKKGLRGISYEAAETIKGITSPISGRKGGLSSLTSVIGDPLNALKNAFNNTLGLEKGYSVKGLISSELKSHIKSDLKTKAISKFI
jgi:hypothetical protein